MTTTPRTGTSETLTTHSRADRIAFVLLAVLQICFSAVLAFMVVLFQFAFDACDEKTCNYGLGDVSLWTGWIGISVAFVGTLVLGLVFRRRGRTTWWIPVAGSGASLAATVLSYYVMLSATGRTHL